MPVGSDTILPSFSHIRKLLILMEPKYLVATAAKPVRAPQIGPARPY